MKTQILVASDLLFALKGIAVVFIKTNQKTPSIIHPRIISDNKLSINIFFTAELINVQNICILTPEHSFFEGQLKRETLDQIIILTGQALRQLMNDHSITVI
ncbi:TPA: hypothetical protein P5S08_002429 [Salmonella enterica subsp. enterica serovar Concord]|nr:hypothetical protein [Salmonella enterica subsp. enterica serovar Concord]